MQVIVPPMDVGTIGTMGLVVDPGQAAIGIWQPGDHKGFQVVGEDGTPAWFELHTRDYDTAVSYYEKVFGWDTHVAGDTPEFRYTTLGEGADQAAGIMDASASCPTASRPPGRSTSAPPTPTPPWPGPSSWGQRGHAAEDTPYGRLATLTDSTGAVFKLGSLQ